MNPVLVVWLCVGAAAAAVTLLLVTSRQRDVLAYLGAYFLYFGLGPAINFATGRAFYEGTNVAQISRACLGITLALAAMSLVGLLVPTSGRIPDRSRLDRTDRRFRLVPALLFGLAGYAVVVLAWRGPAMLSAGKLERIALAGPLHYRYLLVEMLACALYFLVRGDRTARVAYWVNALCYLMYCLFTNERDFLFVALSVLLHIQFFRRRGVPLRLALFAGLGILLGTYLFSVRSGGTDVGLTQALNQGSVLFVDTYVMGLVPTALPFAYGATYLNALLSLLPDPVHVAQPTLMQWLMESFAPDSASGFGFSLTAEAYLNFGLIGAPVVFALLALVQRLLILRVDRNHFFAYASIVFTTAWLYGFRGESGTFLKCLVYGVVFFAVIHLTSTPAPDRSPIRGGRSLGELLAQPGHGGAQPDVERGRGDRGEEPAQQGVIRR